MRSVLNMILCMFSMFATSGNAATFDSDTSSAARAPREIVSIKKTPQGGMLVRREDGSSEVWRVNKDGGWVKMGSV